MRLLLAILKFSYAQNLYQPAPGNPEFTKKYDLSNIPNAKLMTPHAASEGPAGCANQNFCSWGCNGCIGPNDVSFCPNKGDWAMTFDDGNLI